MSNLNKNNHYYDHYHDKGADHRHFKEYTPRKEEEKD